MKTLLSVCILLLSALSFSQQSVFSDQLDNSWVNWSWANTNLTNTTPAHTGTNSISVTETDAWQAMYLHHNSQSTSGYQAIQFWINGGSAGGQTLQVKATLGGNAQVLYDLPALTANTWVRVTVPLAGLGVANAGSFDGFWIADRSGTVQGVYYVDDITLTTKPTNVVDMGIYVDSLVNIWTNMSWATTNFTNTSPIHMGQDSISVKGLVAGDALYVHHDPIDASLYQTITFWINGGAAGGQLLQVNGTASGVGQTPFSLPPLAKNTWQQFIVPLSALGISNRGDFDGIWIADRGGVAEPIYYVDDVVLSTTPPANPPAVISVDATPLSAISSLIYGANSTDYAGMGSGFTFARMGGNRLTAYNWENNASNAGSDWFFQNDDLMGSTNVAGWAGKSFVQAAISGGATPLVTIPTVSYVAADKNGGGDVRNTPNYLSVRFMQNLATKPGGNLAYPPSTSDAFVYQDEFVNYIKRFGTVQHPIMFCLDNEPDLWASTHAEIHPNPVKYAELISNNVSFSKAIKAVSPSALVFGPANYGWYGYRTLQNASDAGGRDFLDFYLQSMKTEGALAKKRLIDVLDLHWYPEATGDGQRITTDADTPGLSDARIQAPRSLWDPTYVENSWIAQSLGGKAIQLLPDTFSRINANYPQTKLAFTEYNYGGGNAISGAIAQADVLGIFGRYGVFAAANWGLNSGNLAELAGFKAFTNYDRSGSKFAFYGVKVTGETPSQNSVYGAVDRADPFRMTLVVINKTPGATPFTINLSKFAPNAAKAYTVSDGHYLTPLVTTVSISAGKVGFTAPPKSITTIELRKIGP